MLNALIATPDFMNSNYILIYILFNFPMYAIYSVNIIIILLLGFNILNSSLKMRLFRPFHFQSLQSSCSVLF